MSDDARLKRRVLDKRTRRHRRPLPSVERGVQMAAYAVHTTGLAPSDRVCELGVATLELVLKAREDSAPRVTDVQSALVDPGMAIAPAATEVHGVTDKMVQGQPSFTSVWSRLGRPAPWIAAHNADFALMHLPVSKDRMICTLACARLLMPEQQHFSLDALVQGLDLPRPDNAATRAAIRRLGLNGVMRHGLAGELQLTDNANLILDVSLHEGEDLEEIGAELHGIPGVVEHGLFLDEADVVLIEHDDGEVERLAKDLRTGA